MKILMLGDYSNLHACLAKELRRRGHEVTLVSDGGGHMQTESDVLLSRRSGIFGSVGYLWKIMSMLSSWKGYDVVQLINPVFFTLKPSKLRMIFDILKRNNRSIFITLCGDDHYFVKDCVEGKLFRFSEYRIGREKSPMALADPDREKGWLSEGVARYHAHLYGEVDGAMSVLPEYDMSARLHMSPEKIVFTNIPVEIGALEYTEPVMNGEVKVLIGMRPDMTIQKGTSRLLDLCREIEKRHPGKVKTEIAFGLSLAEYLRKIRESHVVVDQLYSYSPATNALQTMALGRISATGWQPEYARAIDYQGEAPVIRLAPDVDYAAEFESALLDPGRLMTMSAKGRELVEKENDVAIVAQRFENHWRNALT